MATPYKVHLDPSLKPAFSLAGMNAAGAAKASELLQKNHEEHHIFFNRDGFHNHIAHHLLTLYALGADPQILQKGYDSNAGYQRPPVPLHKKDRVVEHMGEPETFDKYLNSEEYYHDYLVFFQREMDRLGGWENVLNEYLFKGTERADNLLVRMYAGFLHPIIHLGFGIEFRQPAIICEALAQACAHDSWIGKLLLPAEEAAKKAISPGKPMVQLLREIHGDTDLSTAAKWSDGNKVRDGVIARAGERAVGYLSQYRLSPTSSPEDLKKETAEMINTTILFTGSAQHPPKQVKFDFYFIHCVNCSIFFSSFLRQDWLSMENKRRLLEWKVRLDLGMYASRRAPAILKDEITGYRPKQPQGSSTSKDDVFTRVLKFDDDGHASKLVRAIAHGREVSKSYEGQQGFEVQGEMWDKLLHMAIDSVEDSGNAWVRSAGFDEAWANYIDRPQANL